MTSDVQGLGRPFRVAVVGSGPSGFFAADALARSGKGLEITIFDKWPAPTGLVRYGIAPDHQSTKNIGRLFDKVAGQAGVRFMGNVEIGRDIEANELGRFFDAVILAYGASSHRRLGIPGEQLEGSWSANEFSGWYNGEPCHSGLRPNLECESAVIAGNGNVAMDVARILAKGVRGMAATDMTSAALKALGQSRIRDIHVIGRRGPAQASFSFPEIEAFKSIPGVVPLAVADELELDERSDAELTGDEANNRRQNLDLLTEFTGNPTNTDAIRVWFRFLRSPSALEGEGRVQQVRLEINKLEGEAGFQTVRGTGRFETIPCGLFVRCIGYKGRLLPGMPFDEGLGVIPSRAARVLGSAGIMPGWYVAGWIEQGPVGLVATSKHSGQRAAKALLEDMAQLQGCSEPSDAAMEDLLKARGARWTTLADWKKLDQLELERGKSAGKIRDKFVTVQEMLEAL